MRKSVFIMIVLMFTSVNLNFADTGSGESSAGSLTSMPPGAPALSSPEDGSTTFIDPTVVEWDPLDHAASFNLLVSSSETFSSLFVNESALTNTFYSVTGLSGGVTYYWKVSATNVAGTGAYSSVWDFYTDASLSVELQAFSAEPVPGGVRVQWITESETDNLGFILERNAGGEGSQSGTGDGQWRIIASYQSHETLLGQGNSSERVEYSFTDMNIQPGESYTYRLSDVNTQGEIHVYDVIRILLPDAPEISMLDAPFPNPFNPRTRIRYHLSESGRVQVTVYDMLGRKVKTLMDDFQGYGSYNFYWNGRDDAGRQLATGTYVIALQTADGVKTQKVVMMR